MDKLYVVVRRDLSQPQQAVQAIHAAVAFCQDYPQETATWHASSCHVAVLSVADEDKLDRLLDDAQRKGLQVSSFHEPDMSNSLTAICIEPTPRGRKLVQGLPLLGESTETSIPVFAPISRFVISEQLKAGRTLSGTFRGREYRLTPGDLAAFLEVNPL